MLKPDQMQAAKSLLRMIESNPLDVPTYCKLASVYQLAGESRKVNLTLRRALEIDPFYQEAWMRLGIHHMNGGEWRDAADAFEHATRISPSDPSAWIGYGMALIASQNLRRACEVRDLLTARFEHRAETHLIAAHISKIRGNFAAAAHSYRRALEFDPEQAEALYNLTDLLSPSLTDPLTQHLESLLHAQSFPSRELAMRRFSLARIYEKAGEVERALALYRDANAAAAAMMQGSRNAYDTRDAEEEVERTIELCSRATAANPLQPLDLDIKLIFIVGLPRSGTTLTESILSNHSRVSAGGELPFMQECLAKLHRSSASTNSSALRRLLGQLRNEYLDALFESELDDDYVTDKLPVNFSALGLVRILFPDALIVHCSRNPVATCWSLYTSCFDSHLSYNTSFDHLIHYYTKVYARYMRHWAGTDGMNIINVEYDELVADSEYRIRQLLADCGLEWEAACARIQDNERPIFTASAAQARRPIYSTSVDRWRVFAQHLRPLMDGLRDARTSGPVARANV